MANPNTKIFTQHQMAAQSHSINCTESSSLDSGYQRSHESLTTSQDYRNHNNDPQVYNAYAAHERLSQSPFPLDKVGGFPQQQTALTTRSATGGWNFHSNQQPAIRNHHYSYADPKVPFKYQIDAQAMDPTGYLATTASMISSGYNASVDQGIVMDHGPFVCPQNVQPVVPFCPHVVMQLPQASQPSTSTQQAQPQQQQPASSSNNDVTKAEESDDEVIYVASYHQSDPAAKRKPRKARRQPPKPKPQQERKESSDDDVICTGYIPAPAKATRSAGRKQVSVATTSSPNTRSRLKRPMAANSKQVPITKRMKQVKNSRKDLKKEYADFFKNYNFHEKYQVLKEIGKGGGGTVYAGKRRKDGLNVAIKKIDMKTVKRWSTLSGCTVPIEFALYQKAAKQNKGVVQPLDWYEYEKKFLLVMERTRNSMDLFDLMNSKGPLQERHARKIFRQVVQAVTQCHVNGVVHRDIKDENVLVNPTTFEAKIIDFGCAAKLKNEDYHEFAGTPEFYPPEWFKDRRYNGKTLDTWSLGVLLYTMMESEVPFKERSDITKCELVFKRSPQSSRGFIRQLLVKEESKRLKLEDIRTHPWMTVMS